MMKIGLIVTRFLVFEGLNIIIHKESSSRLFDNRDAFDRVLYPADPRLKPINTFKRQILTASVVV
jgi:hypothetical protein